MTQTVTQKGGITLTESERKLLREIDKLRREKVSLENENSVIKNLVTAVKSHSINCDGDERAIQPIEILDIIASYDDCEIQGI